MTSNECLKNICLECEKEKGKNKIACPFRSISNDYCYEVETIEKDLGRLEELEKENQEANEIIKMCNHYISDLENERTKLKEENQELKSKNVALELWNDCYTKENAKLKKAMNILKNKKVNIFHIWVFDDYMQYKLHYIFSEYHAEEDMLTEEEFNYLKEVFEYE